jgi:exopolysaccharide biosynthesis polyprenyl glycosylphosphotransferase
MTMSKLEQLEQEAARSRAPDVSEPAARSATRAAGRRRYDYLPRHRPVRVPIAAREVMVDAIMLTAAGAASAITARAAGADPVSIPWLVVFSLGALALLAAGGNYRPTFTLHLFEDLGAILGATAVAAMGVVFIRVLSSDTPSAASEAVRAWLFAATYLAAGRAGMELMLLRTRKRGEWAEPTLIVGAGRVGQLVARRLMERPEFGLRPVAFLDDDPLDIDKGVPDVPVLSTGENGTEAGADRRAFAARLEGLIRGLRVGYVIVTFSLTSHETELRLVRTCQELGVSVSLVPRLFEGIPDQTRLERLGGLPLISVHPTDPQGWQYRFKYAADRVFAAIGVVLLSPLIAVAALGTLVTLGRPVLFRQRRVGLDGRVFEMVKFRTMRPEPDGSQPDEGDDIPEDIAPGGVEGDDRRTRFGTVLRRSSIDELPQLFNVLRGEMSLIGPRPERVGHARRFDRKIYRYDDRHRVKSGITGWAQVHKLRGKTSLADRVEWDNYYVENWSLWLDLKIVPLTLLAVLRDRSE